jgi:hypothetical protein
MKALLTSFGSGILFALGLGISGMTRPVKVIGFLDFFGAWDASLAFVMLGAIAVYFVAYRWSRKMPSPLLAPDFSLPKRRDLDARLILGGARLWTKANRRMRACPGLVARVGSHVEAFRKWRMYRRIRPRDEHAGEVDVTVAHSQHQALSAESLPRLQIGQRRVPRDIDMAGDERVDEDGIT